jgi:hypothetical protein
LIYVAAYEDRSMVAHVEFDKKEAVFLQNPEKYKIWRSLLYKELDERYKVHPPLSKKCKSSGTASERAAIVVERQFIYMDNFVDCPDAAKG